MKSAFGVVVFFLTVGLLAGTGGCDDEAGTSKSDLQAAPDAAHVDDSTSDPDSQVTQEPVRAETQVVNWSDNGESRSVAMRILRPEQTCTKDTPCPLVVLVPDRLEAGLDSLTTHATAMARKLGCVVVVYNAPGRGSGWDKSSGEEDYHGTSGQDALVRVIKEAEMPEYVDPDQVGIVSVGFGLSAAAGALGRFHETGLAEVDYLIDVEGPINRCYMSQSPYIVNQAEGWYINEDGQGWQSPGRCDFDLHSRKEKFPGGTSSDGKGTDGTPNSYICNKQAFPLKQAGVSCDDDNFFKTREPKILMNRMGVHYLRLQFRYDHEQPTCIGSLEALHYASSTINNKPSNLLSIQLNDVKVDTPNLHLYPEAQLASSGAFLSVKGVGNGFGTDLFVKDGTLSPVTATELWQVVLPAYIKRMQQRSIE